MACLRMPFLQCQVQWLKMTFNYFELFAGAAMNKRFFLTFILLTSLPALADSINQPDKGR